MANCKSVVYAGKHDGSPVCSRTARYRAENVDGLPLLVTIEGMVECAVVPSYKPSPLYVPVPHVGMSGSLDDYDWSMVTVGHTSVYRSECAMN